MFVCYECGKEINLDPTEPTDHDGWECPQCGDLYCEKCGGWTVVDDMDVCKNCAEKAKVNECPQGGDTKNDCEGCAYSGDYHYENGECVRRKEMIKLTPVGIDGWDRVVFKGDNGRFYKTTELAPAGGLMSLNEEEQLELLRSLHSTDCFDGEPDFPCWKEGAFSIDFNRG